MSKGVEPLNLPRRPRFVEFEGRRFSSDQLRTLAASLSIVRLDLKNCAVGDDDVRLLCDLPRLQDLWLAGTGVTDAVLPFIARLPQLEWLILDGTRVTGPGFAALSGHSGLRTLWLSNTTVGDAVVPHLVTIPRLSTLVVGNTGITSSGLMQLAAHPTVGVSANDQFTDDQLAEFVRAQRRNANRTPVSFQPSPADATAAAETLRGFFTAINEWERHLANAESAGEPTDDGKAQCREIFAKFCTTKPRRYGRPNVISYSDPPEYERHEPVDTEWLGARKVLFYTIDPESETQYRFVVVKRGNRWLLDSKEVRLDGWDPDTL